MGSDMRILRALLFFLLLLSGDVESNPGPPKKGKMFDTVGSLSLILEKKSNERGGQHSTHYTLHSTKPYNVFILQKQ